METVTSRDGTTVAYAHSGDGPPLVLVHGSAGDHSRWSLVSPALEQRYTVYAIDRRGRGGSGPYAGAPIEREFEDVAAVVEATGEPAFLLGSSYGAHCALGAAILTPRLRKLVLYEPPIVEPSQEPFARRMRELVAAGDHDGGMFTFFRDLVGAPEPMVEALRTTPDWKNALLLAESTAHEVRALGEYAWDPKAFRDLQTPTLLLVGSESDPHLTDASVALAGVLPDVRLVTFERQGHIAHITAPDLFVRQVVKFLAD